MAFLKNIFYTRKILDDKPFMFFFLNEANHIKCFSMLHKVRYGTQDILYWTLTPFQPEKFQLELSQYSESLGTKIVARLQSSGLD